MSMDVSAKGPPQELVETCRHEVEKIQGSRFLAFAEPCSDVDNLRKRQQELRAEHPHSRHVCFGWVGATDQDTRCSDDGEPSKTAGIPILRVLLGAALRDTGLLVVRYFGGSKLGTGGLVRAYTHAAQQCLHQALTRSIEAQWTGLLVGPYASEPRLRHLLSQHGGQVLREEYGTRIQLRIRLPEARTASFRQLLTQQEQLTPEEST